METEPKGIYQKKNDHGLGKARIRSFVVFGSRLRCHFCSIPWYFLILKIDWMKCFRNNPIEWQLSFYSTVSNAVSNKVLNIFNPYVLPDISFNHQQFSGSLFSIQSLCTSSNCSMHLGCVYTWACICRDVILHFGQRITYSLVKVQWDIWINLILTTESLSCFATTHRKNSGLTHICQRIFRNYRRLPWSALRHISPFPSRNLTLSELAET